MTLDELLGRAATHLDRKELHQSLALLDEAVEQYPWDHRPWQLRGGVRQMAGEFSEAIRDLERARSLGQLCSSAQLSLADCYRRAGYPDRATATARLLASNDDVPANVLSRICCLFGLLGEYSDALELCERIVAEREDFHSAWFGIAYYRARLEFSSSQILPFLERAWELDPTSHLYGANVGLLRIDTANVASGLRTLSQLHKRSIRCPSLLRLLVRTVTVHGGDADEWREWIAELEEETGRSILNSEGADPCPCCVCLPPRVPTAREEGSP